MTKPIRPDVSDPDLRAALDRFGAHIENYTANLDAISKDIRALEEYLSASGVRVSASVTTGVGAPVVSDPDASGPYHQDEETIAWGPLGDHQGPWRLAYGYERRYGDLPDTPEGEGRGKGIPILGGLSESLEYKPLIETPAGIRIRVYKFLPLLVEELGKLLRVSEEDDTDGPF